VSKLKEAFYNAFFDEESSLFTDSEISSHSSLHANAIPAFFGLVPEHATSSVIKLIKNKGLSCGVQISYFVLKALTRMGETELVYDFILNEGKNSWANMLREGATACFEVWGKEQKGNISLCHAWASAPIPILIEDIIGLKPAAAGWKKIQLDCKIPEKLASLHLELQLDSGHVSLSCKNGKILNLLFDIDRR